MQIRWVICVAGCDVVLAAWADARNLCADRGLWSSRNIVELCKLCAVVHHRRFGRMFDAPFCKNRLALVVFWFLHRTFARLA
jgi:hypothetical protein